MRISAVLACALLSLLAHSPLTAKAESIDGRVVQVYLPFEDVHLAYVERKGGFTVELKTKSASIEGQKMYIGDGKLAVELVAHPTNGIFLQGDPLRQGDQFRTGTAIKVKAVFRRASELSPGDIYVVLPGVRFAVADKPQ